MNVNIKVEPTYHTVYTQEEMVNFLCLMEFIPIDEFKAILKKHCQSTYQCVNLEKMIDRTYETLKRFQDLKEQVILARQTFESIKVADALLK